MYITIALLKEHKACQDQVDLFAATFPDGVQVTAAVCLAAADKFDFDWAADTLLPDDKWAEYKAKHAPIYAEYEAKRAPIDAEYEATRDVMRAEYLTRRDASYAEYKAKRAPIWAEYWGKHAPILDEYNRQQAALFGQIAETIAG